MKDINRLPALLLTDSCCDVPVIGSPREDISARAASNVIAILRNSSFKILLQFISSHGKIIGSEGVDWRLVKAFCSRPSSGHRVTYTTFLEGKWQHISSLFRDAVASIQHERCFLGSVHSPLPVFVDSRPPADCFVEYADPMPHDARLAVHSAIVRTIHPSVMRIRNCARATRKLFCLLYV